MDFLQKAVGTLAQCGSIFNNNNNQDPYFIAPVSVIKVYQLLYYINKLIDFELAVLVLIRVTAHSAVVGQVHSCDYGSALPHLMHLTRL